MKAFHSDKKIKKFYLDRIKAHALADEIVKGNYWQHGKGCAVGCTIHSGNHSSYETELGIPQVLARLEDGLFERLPNHFAMTWPKRFLNSIKPGADLSHVWPKFAIWLLTDPQYGVIQFAKNEQTKLSIKTVSDLYVRSLKETILPSDWSNAANAADVSSAYAEDAAVYAIAAASAAVYAIAAASAAGGAIDVVAYAATAHAVGSSAYAVKNKVVVAQSKKLLQLLKECK